MISMSPYGDVKNKWKSHFEIFEPQILALRWTGRVFRLRCVPWFLGRSRSPGCGAPMAKHGTTPNLEISRDVSIAG